MENKDYTLILNNNILSDAIIASDKIVNYEHHQANGFDGEILNAFTSSLDVIIAILALIVQYRATKANGIGLHEDINANSEGEEGEDEEEDDEILITIIGPEGFEYRNVPMCKVSVLLRIIKKQHEQK